MYELTDRLVSEEDLAFLHEQALGMVPLSAGSFMLPFLWIPSAFVSEEICKLQLVGLLPSQQIVAHKDRFRAGSLRYHLPLQVNASCWSFHAGVWQQLVEGKVYQMDPTETHGAVNWGETLRLHLMIDLEEHARSRIDD